MKIYLGLDCGGTKTVAVASNQEGKKIGRGVAGAANPLSVGAIRTVENIISAINNAIYGISDIEIESVYIGMAGGKPAMLKEIRKRLLLTPELRNVHKLTVDHDLRIALYAGIEDGNGIILIAGTGSAAWTVDKKGNEILVSGWNHWLGETGGYELGMKAIIASTRAYDGRGPETLLLKKIMKAYQISDFEEISLFIRNSTDSPKIASIAPLVIECAQLGDEVSIQIIEDMIKELDCSLRAAARRSKMKGHIKVVLVGGMFNMNYDVLGKLKKLVHKWNKEIEFVFPFEEPAKAAVRLAMQ